MDALSEILRAIHLSGTAFIDADLSAPWAVQTPTPAEIAKHLAPGSGRVIPYHLVAEGSCSVRIGSEPPIALAAQDVVWFPHGDVHVLASEPGLEPMRITADAIIRLTRPDSVTSTRFGGEGPKVRLICGFFACDTELSEPLVQSLPRVLKFRGDPETAAALLPASMAASRRDRGVPARPGSKAVLCKLSELLFVDAVRAYVDTLREKEGGWFAGLKDPLVAHALALVHERPAVTWTLERLAGEVGTSRTTLAERFVRCLGNSPMQYIAQWRLRLAAHALVSTDRAIKKIAGDAGFGTPVAFGRAFKREMGTSPGAWRKNTRNDQ